VIKLICGAVNPIERMTKLSYSHKFAVVACALLLSFLVGCNTGEDITDEIPVYVFVPQFTSLSAIVGDLPNIGNLTVTENRVYFISLLEFTNSLEQRIDWGNVTDEVHRSIQEGQQIMTLSRFRRFSDYSVYRDLFGGDIVLKGFPSVSEGGESLNILTTDTGFAILSTSENQPGAWEFLRMVLSEDWQRRSMVGNFPTNSNVLLERKHEAMFEAESATYIFAHDAFFEVRPLAQEQADNVLALIDSAYGLSASIGTLLIIILETTSDLYVGTITVQDASRIIQSRAGIFVAEQTLLDIMPTG
jgi:hypothetical protein